ncbi:MAG: GNAT family N-acetyltransferase [Candidatus Limnocylindrales bacterium]
MTSLLADDGEQLTTGWEPDVAAGDSVVRQAVLVHASWANALARSIDRPWMDGPEWAAGNCDDRGALSNWVVLKRPLLDLERVVAALDEMFPPGVPFLMVSAWPTPDLRAHRLGLVGHPPLMLRPPSTPTQPPPCDLELRWVSGADELIDAERVMVDGYPLPDMQPFHPGRLYAPALLEGPTSVVVAYDGDGTPLATAAAHSAHGVTLVENVAVLRAARGRGAGAAVTWAATRSVPGQPAVLIASDDGQPVYERLGYLRLERWTVWLRSA